MYIPAVTRKYTPGSARNSRKPMRLPPRCEMRPNSPALRAEQLCFPNQMHKEPPYAWMNSRESPTTLSQDEKDTEVTSGTQNSSVYPKWNWDEANFPFFGSITIPQSTSYRTSCLTPFMKLQIFPEKPVQVKRIINFSRAIWGMFRAPYIISGWEWFPVFNWRGKPNFHNHLKRSLPSSIGMWEGLCVFCLKWNGLWDALTQNKPRFHCSALNAGSSFISQDEGMSESPVETLEKALGLHLFWTGGLTLLWNLERHMEFNASKGEDAWLFVKIDMNPNITVQTNKGCLASPLTSRSVCIGLPSLV